MILSLSLLAGEESVQCRTPEVTPMVAVLSVVNSTLLMLFLYSREDFVSEVNEFNQSYDLTGAGVRYREQQAKRKVAVLKEELKLLKTGQMCLQYYNDYILCLVYLPH